MAIYELCTRKARLFNPLTNAQMSLPHFPSPPDFDSVVVFGSPNKGSFKVFFHQEHPSRQYIARVGAAAPSCDHREYWTRINAGPNNEVLGNFVLYKDRFYAINATRNVIVVVDESVVPLTFTDVVACTAFATSGSVSVRLAHCTVLVPGVDALLLGVQYSERRKIFGENKYSERPRTIGRSKWQAYRVEMEGGWFGWGGGSRAG